MIPPRHSPQRPPVDKDEWYPLYCMLAEGVDGHNTRRDLRDEMLSALNEAAAKARDSDAMRLYEEFPLVNNRNLIGLIPAMRKTLKIDSLEGILTQEHIDAHRTLNDLYTRSTIMWDKRAWEKLQSFLLSNLSQADAIVRIVEAREVFDPKEIAILLKLSEDVVPALAEGML
jgi:hypothetical protein